MMLFQSKIVALLASILAFTATTTRALQFSREQVGDNGFQDDPLLFVDRLYVPYGPNLVTTPQQTDQPWSGYAYGLGATEHWAYDYKEKYIYSQSEAGGYITIVDWSTLPGQVTPYSLDVCGQDCEIRDIVVCPEQGLFLITRTELNDVLVYDTVKRQAPAIPTLVEEVKAGNSPDAMKLSNDCRILAVANANEGTDKINLGAVTLITNFWPSDAGDAVSRTISLTQFDESYLLERQVHLPLTKNAAVYWNTEAYEAEDGANTYGWEEAGGIINQFNPAIVMGPEFLAFNQDGSELFMNLQQNSALVRIDTATAVARSIDGYGLKSFGTSSEGVDIVKDGTCSFVKNDCLYLAKSPDAIVAVEYEGVNYILTADEGSDFELEPFSELRSTADLFGPGATFLHSGFTFDPSFFVPGDATAGCTANFQADCETNLAAGLVDWCSNLDVTIGSSAVDYSNVTAPKMEKIIGFGGRGIGIYRLPSDPEARMVQVFDSASQFEKEICDQFAWAHNALQDEEFAPACDEANIEEATCPAWILADEEGRVDLNEKNDPEEGGCTSTGGACPMGETVDEKAEEDGLGVESVAVAIACDRLVAVACGENNAACLLYDITDITQPTLLKTFHLSEASRTKNPEQSYRKDLGDIDSETIIWIQPSHSPTGKSGFLFGGAISGTLSFYEFQCLKQEDGSGSASGSSSDSGSSSGSDSSSGSGLSTGAIVGIVVGVVAVVVIAVVFIMRNQTPKSDTQDKASSAPAEGPATYEVA